MYGWRARVGLILPHVNTTAEPEFNRLAPAGVSFHVARMLIPELTVDGLIAMGQETERAALELADLNASAICFCCTSGSFIKGAGYDVELAERIKKVTGAPATATSVAVVEALRLLGLTRVAMVTPYEDAVNEREVAFLDSYGIEVVKFRGLGIGPRLPMFPLAGRSVSHIGLQEPSVAYNLAKKVMTPEAEGLFISCTNFRTIEVLDALERELEVPVVSANQATFWSAMRLAGVREEIDGYGSLLRRLGTG